MKKPEYDLMCHWIIKAWNDIPAEIIIKSFEKCGLSNVLKNEDNAKEIKYELEKLGDIEEVEYDIVLGDENKENEEIIATARTHNIEVTERNHLIEIDEREE
ncbi:267_t:CDS:1 [Dentiscutata erythropus]|uniref:267_t:CDS:1 n=1 Tax=Dentiscutata erythropus TaxID=1348616 RepID=A0A9N9JMS3_9GLOM|nr:267_t:CDS:1 [Dentiscutata erythropus]